MKNLLFLVCGIALIVTVTSAFAQNFLHNSQSSSVQSDVQSDSQSSSVQSENNSDSDSDMTSFTSQQSSSDSSGYQRSSLTLSAANLRQPHMLSINTSGNQMTGEITVNGKVVKKISNNKVEIDLSPYLSVGEHTVEISARYAPTSSSVSVELSGPGTNITQQNSGNGILSYTMNVSVR